MRGLNIDALSKVHHPRCFEKRGQRKWRSGPGGNFLNLWGGPGKKGSSIFTDSGIIVE
jgi:hypothetical protein